MDIIETKLAVILDGLKKKEQALEEIISITENQFTVIQSGLPLGEVRAFILEMNYKKNEFIQTVKSCDDMFERILKEVGPELDARQDMYKPQVAKLQTRISRVMDLDVKIRIKEEENNKILDALRQNEKKPVYTVKPADKAADMKPMALPADLKRVAQAYADAAKNFKG